MSKKGASETEQHLQQQAAKFFERAKSLDFNRNDAIAAATVAGLGLATVVGFLAARKLGNRVTTPGGEEVAVAREPAQYMEGVVSYVRLPDGRAASFPADDESETRLRDGKVEDAGIFIMDPEGGVTRGAHRDPRYKQVAEWAISFVSQVLPDFAPEGQEELAPPPPEA